MPVDIYVGGIEHGPKIYFYCSICSISKFFFSRGAYVLCTFHLIFLDGYRINTGTYLYLLHFRSAVKAKAIVTAYSCYVWLVKKKLFFEKICPVPPYFIDCHTVMSVIVKIFRGNCKIHGEASEVRYESIIRLKKLCAFFVHLSIN